MSQKWLFVVVIRDDFVNSVGHGSLCLSLYSFKNWLVAVVLSKSVCVCFFFFKGLSFALLNDVTLPIIRCLFFFLVEKNGKKKSKGRIIRSTAAFAVFHFPELIIILLSC